jgi:uncharacterized ferritin-like protein (DUF455 family)
MSASNETTVERWALELIETRDLTRKLDPLPPPDTWERQPVPRRELQPGRPPELRVVTRAEKTPRPGALVHTRQRARLLHAFFHHELQATELFAWAILAFPEAPRELRAGFAKLLLDEARHARLYAGEVERLGFAVGAFPVRDWFWQRVPACRTPAQFLAVMGLGLEAANLDHAAVWAERLRAAGDERAARVQELVGREEEAHVRFGATWYARLTGGLDFESWRADLPAPLSPTLFRGLPLERGARGRAGLDAEFLDALEAWQPAPSGS